MEATYSPEDNKLRLRAGGRLDPELYARVKAAGFRWAPRQELFVAPAWTPDRDDLLRELCGDIGDEDTSLVERAEERAGRFDEYSDHRRKDAEGARQAVSAIADHIPMGQPILVGHHSEKRARRDAEKIQRGMEKAVRMWDTAEYWRDRAAGALRHARYKERPDVRARRIKKLEAEHRKQAREVKTLESSRRLWELLTDEERFPFKKKDGTKGTILERATFICGGTSVSYDTYSQLEKGEITPEAAQERALAHAAKYLAWHGRWLAHLDNRLAYERAMLGEAGGTLADRKPVEKGGAVRCWASPRGGWSYVEKVNRVSVSVLDNWGNGGKNFRRVIPFDKLGGIMSATEVSEARAAGHLRDTEDRVGFYLIEKPTEEPKSEEPPAKVVGADFEGMRASLRAGVKAVSAPQLFPTPPELAARMVELADIAAGDRVLEPSAGTGAIVGELLSRSANVVAVELSQLLSEQLRNRFPGSGQTFTRLVLLGGQDPLPDVPLVVVGGDFLQEAGKLGVFDAVVMNPPFSKAEDVKHIHRAWELLKPGGMLVALCANGPKQAPMLAAFCELGGEVEALPSGTFGGTDVRAALLAVRKDAAAQQAVS